MCERKSLFFANVMTETNSFSNIPTSRESFVAEGLAFGDDLLFEDGRERLGLIPVFDLARRMDWDLVGGVLASSAPAAPVQQRDYEELRDDLLARLKASAPFGAVILFLHGAMQSTLCRDCEGDILRRIRGVVGPNTPVGVVLDPHAHLTDDMVEAADICIFMKEYPHTDGGERLEEVIAVVADLARGSAPPVPVVLDCHTLGFFPTDRGPMTDFVAALQQAEQDEAIVSASFIHGFPWGDTPTTGAQLLVYARDAAGVAKAQKRAEDLRAQLWDLLDKAGPELISIETAIERARASEGAPIILADISDNPGGGAPSDSTFILRALLNAGVTETALGLLYDPVAVEMCHQVGIGGTLSLRLGGKMSPFSGEPIDCEAKVLGVAKEARMQVVDDVSFAMGDTACVDIKGIKVILSSQRKQMYAPSGFEHLGIDPAKQKLLVVKSSNHFRAFFADIAGDIWDVVTPGAINFDYAALPYRHLSAQRYPINLSADELCASLSGPRILYPSEMVQ
ncbi:MAG: M81 family metallopeptidase [Pseudomonadota bacterium]